MAAMAGEATRPRGALILFEGIDRCGKSTQVKLLADHLKTKTECEEIRFPDRTSYIGKLINDYLAMPRARAEFPTFAASHCCNSAPR
jgi:dTMP kinase